MENKTILMIEDNELNRKLVKALLQRGSYNILGAIDAESGIRIAKEQRPDLILMDIQLPGMDGLSATRILKEDAALRGIPVIALTSYAMEGDVENAKRAGCEGYISKPINTQGFLDMINKFFQNGPQKELWAPRGLAGKSKILIVDDDPLNVKLFVAKLPPDQYETIKAHDGNEALQVAAKESLDLILLDIMMPGMDGYELTRRLKKDPVTRDIPVILITALGRTEDKVKGFESGADAFLNKPVNSIELLAKMQCLIRLKQNREQLTTRTQSQAFSQVPRRYQELRGENAVAPSILLVEDNRDDARLIQQCLNGPSFHLDFASNGEEALARAERGKIDLILLDILLPGIDGIEVCRRLKEKSHTRNIQIAMISCLSDLESKIKSLEMGADDYLVKPINPYELKARVNALLKKKLFLDRLNGGYAATLQAAISDPPTGLYNRAYFEHFLELEMKRSLRQKYPLAVIMIAIDDFKQFRDTLGASGGDRILQEVGQIIKSNFREVDCTARHGGEEFAVVMPYCDGMGARKSAQRVGGLISSHSFLQKTDWPPQHLTVSMGVAEFVATFTNVEKLIQTAEEALNRSRREAKHRVNIRDHPLRVPETLK